jgi:hypothetical protein
MDASHGVGAGGLQAIREQQEKNEEDNYSEEENDIFDN